jgi:hypothetical protein
MITRTLPGFTANASLYKTSRHYRTGNRAINLRIRQMGTMRLSAIDVPGEVIEIEDDVPWSPPSWGGHTGPGTSGPPGETGGGGGGASGGTKPPPKKPPKKPPKTPPKKPPRPGKDDPQEILHGCSERQMQKKAAKPCNKQHDDDFMRGVANPHYVSCTGEPKGKVVHPKMECCQDWDDDVTICDPLN